MLGKLDFTYLPDVKGSYNKNTEILSQIKMEIESFKELMRKANYPCKGCCGKRYSCFCWFKETFSSHEQ